MQQILGTGKAVVKVYAYIIIYIIKYKYKFNKIFCIFIIFVW